jgi:hypothetical protein
MMTEQLELFPGTDANEAVSTQIVRIPSAERTLASSTVPFPVDRQIAYVRKIARALDGRDERLAAKYWCTECNRLIGRLQVQGFNPATIRAEVVRFGNAVSMHRSNDGRQQPTGGAA